MSCLARIGAQFLQSGCFRCGPPSSVLIVGFTNYKSAASTIDTSGTFLWRSNAEPRSARVQPQGWPILSVCVWLKFHSPSKGWLGRGLKVSGVPRRQALISGFCRVHHQQSWHPRAAPQQWYRCRHLHCCTHLSQPSCQSWNYVISSVTMGGSSL
jgi:hypothetical protein